MAKFEKYRANKNRQNIPDIDDLLIRKANLDDITGLARIRRARDDNQAEYITNEFDTELKNSDQDNRLLLVAELNGHIVGYARASYFTPGKDAPANVCPEGWYLTGIIVDPQYRRLGIALKLTRARLAYIAPAASEVYYFANAQNAVSIALHDKLGFKEVSRDFFYPNVEFEGGAGILFKAELKSPGST